MSLPATAGAIGLAKEHCNAGPSGHCRAGGTGSVSRYEAERWALTERSLAPRIGRTEIEMLAYES